MNCLRVLLLLVGICLTTVMPRMYAFAADGLVFMWEKTGDVFIANGSQLVLNCSYTNRSVPYADVSQLRILKGSVNVSAMYLHTYLEDRTLQLYIPHTQINDSATYVCMDGVNSPNSPQLKMVNIGVEPPLPENITCVSENFQNLVCSFNKPSATYIPVGWSMEYSFDDVNSQSTVNGSCPLTEDSLVVVHCRLDGEILTNVNYTVTLHMYNALYGFSKKKTVEVVLDESIVIPPVVDNLKVNQTGNSRGVNLNWTFPLDLPSSIKLIYRVTLHNQWGEQKLWNVDKIGCVLTDLIPNTKYSVEVQSKPVRAVGDVYWSTPAICNFTTHPDLPDEGPIVTEGAFVQGNCRTKGTCLVLYWKNPLERQVNGALIGYKIIIASGDMKNEKIKNEILYNFKSEIQSSVCIKGNGLQCNESEVYGERISVEVPFYFPNYTGFVAGIALKNTVGFSKPSFIAIPALQQVAPKPDLVIVEEGESNFQVSWMWDKRNLSMTTVTYFWCTRNRLRANATLLCEGTLGTHTVPSSTSVNWKSFTLDRKNISIPASDQSILYFAVALLQNETSGGMVWQGCKFVQGKAPNKPAYQVVPVETNGTQLQIEIPRDLLCQADNAGRPLTYTVSYKQVVDDYKEEECHQDRFSNQTFKAELEREIQHYTLSGLTAGANYIVCLGSANRDSQSVQYGRGFIIKTARPGASKSETSPLILIVAVSTVAVGVIIIIFLCFCFKRLRRCVKRPQIIVPDVPAIKRERVDTKVDEVYIEVNDTEETGAKVIEINNKIGGPDADSGTGGSVESSVSGDSTIDEIEVSEYVTSGRRDSGTSSGKMASYERLVKTRTYSGNLNEASEKYLDGKETNLNSLIKSVVDITTDTKTITRPECQQVYPVSAASGSVGNSFVQSYVVAAFQEGKNPNEYLPNTDLERDLERLKLVQKEMRTLKPSIGSPITSLELKTLGASQVKQRTEWNDHSVHSGLEHQHMAEKINVKALSNSHDASDGSYVQATLKEKEKDKIDEEEVKVEELEEEQEGMEASWEENRSSNNLHNLDDDLCDRTIESLLDSGSTTVAGYVKPNETNLTSGSFCISDTSSGLGGSLMQVYIKPADVTLANNLYHSGMDLSCDEVAKIEEIPLNFKSGDPQESSNSQRKSFQNNAASYIHETLGLSNSKSHSRDETGSESPLRDESPTRNNSSCQSKDMKFAVNTYTSDSNFSSKEENHSPNNNECHLEKEISTKNNSETHSRGETPELNDNALYARPDLQNDEFRVPSKRGDSCID